METTHDKGQGTWKRTNQEETPNQMNPVGVTSYVKGLSLPINMVVIVGIVVLVLVVVGVFFLTSTGGQLSQAEAQQVFAQGCNTFCQSDPCGNAFRISQYAKAYSSSTEFHHRFAQACAALSYAPTADLNLDQAKQCLIACGSCEVRCDSTTLPPN